MKPCIIFFITFSYLQLLFSAQEKSSRTINYPKFTRKQPVYSSVSLKRSTFSFFLKLMFSWTLVIDKIKKKTKTKKQGTWVAIVTHLEQVFHSRKGLAFATACGKSGESARR